MTVTPDSDTFRGPRVAGPLPGPVSARMLARQDDVESAARTYPRHLPIALEEASGSFVRDVDGNVFIDFLAGAGVLSLGHNHPELADAVTDQLARLTHGLDFPTPLKEEFTQAALSTLPESLRDSMRVHFCGPTGANAVEAAIKLCKTATGRGDIVSFQGGFHGSTAGAMAVTGLLEQKEPVSNQMPGVHFFPYSYCSRCPLGLTPETCDTNCAVYLDRSLHDSNGGVPRPAAVILELIQGEGGVIPATPEFARRVGRVAHELGVPLIVDEVQAGYGRTGTWFAFEQYDLEPDVIVASKALSGIGLPVAVIFYRKSLDVWAPGAHTGTFRGNQLAFAAGTAAVRIMRRDNILGNVRARGEQIVALLEPLTASPWVRDVRGRGLMWGIEMADPVSGEPAGDLARRIQLTALQHGLILECGGRQDCVVRLLPPLNVTEEVVATACAILRDAVTEEVAAQPGA